jgi:hypothetical protein
LQIGNTGKQIRADLQTLTNKTELKKLHKLLVETKNDVWLELQDYNTGFHDATGI